MIFIETRNYPCGFDGLFGCKSLIYAPEIGSKCQQELRAIRKQLMQSAPGKTAGK